MRCPACKHELKKVATRQGVLVEHCASCKGVWLDEGKIYLFSKHPEWMAENLEKGLLAPHGSQRECPKCQEQKLTEGGFVNDDLLIDQCSQCKGIWFDDGELKKALELGTKKFKMALAEDSHGLYYASPDETNQERFQERREKARSGKQDRLDALRYRMISLPSLAMRSVFSFVVLYGMLFFALIVVGEFLDWSIHVVVLGSLGVVFLQYLIGPFLIDLSLKWLYDMRWVQLEELPEETREFIRKTCKEHKMEVPRLGIIEDGAPNAFTYGHTPNNARVLVTRGIFEYLDPEEVNAVVGHELGHARHWDILVMTLASVVPLILYYIFRIFYGATRGGGSGKGKGGAAIMALMSYLLYIVAEYVVLWLSRTREYWADRFSGEATGKPNALASALVKIAYGLVAPRKEKEKKGGDEEKEEKDRSYNLEAIKAFGIFDPKAAQALALNAYPQAKKRQAIDSEESKERIASAMQWDLWNPWAAYYEIHSTHPLPAKRIDALTDQAAAMQQEPFIVFNRKKPESYWDEFFVDVLIGFLPLFPFLLLIGFLYRHVTSAPKISGFIVAGTFFVAWALCYWMKTLFSYRGKVFARMKVETLLSKVKVSNVRPVPVTVSGKIVGKGVPGYLFSEDMVMEDETGIMFLDYRQPLGLIELWFALMRTDKYIGQQVTIQGWYRRAPIPYIEIKTIWKDGQPHHCYVYHFKLVFALMLALVGVVCFLSVLMR